jgi:hypothetical protein
MLFWALLASGQIVLRKVDGWISIAQPLAEPIDLSADEERPAGPAHKSAHRCACRTKSQCVANLHQGEIGSRAGMVTGWAGRQMSYCNPMNSLQRNERGISSIFCPE